MILNEGGGQSMLLSTHNMFFNIAITKELFLLFIIIIIILIIIL